MRLGIIATVIDSPHLTGVEKYALEMIRKIPCEIRPFVSVFCNKGGAGIIRSVAGDMTLHVSPSANRIFCDQFWLPYAVRHAKMDFVYNASLSHPWVGLGKVPFGIMLHDATPWRFPDTISKGMRYYYLPQLNQAIASPMLKLVITNSQSSASDIERYCKIPDSRIVPIHLGVDFGPYTNDPRKQADRSSALTNVPYILTVGTIEPRKNLSTLFLAFSKIQARHPDLKLLVVGRHGWQQQLDIPDDVADKIVFTGYVADSDLLSLYACAKLFVFPSMYEGFGLPLLEAMAAGTPVLASDSSSLPEIGGDVCLYADPLSPDDFAEKMHKLLSDEKLLERMAADGVEHARGYSWDVTVSKSWETICRIASFLREGTTAV